jgi:hypothetical protein
VIPGLREELEYQATRKGEIPEDGLEITIMGDHELPYWLLKKVMLTCQQTEFAKISLAVNSLANENTELIEGLPDTASLSTAPVMGGAI